MQALVVADNAYKQEKLLGKPFTPVRGAGLLDCSARDAIGIGKVGVGEKYIAAVADGARAIPVLIPALGDGLDLEDLLERFDGLLLTGSPSNVEPHHYGGPASDPGTLHDPERDATTLPMIPRAIAAGMPVLAICRGFQEMNVTFGGTLLN